MPAVATKIDRPDTGQVVRFEQSGFVQNFRLEHATERTGTIPRDSRRRLLNGETATPHTRLAFKRLLCVVAAVIAVPVIPFLILGSAFEDRISGWFQQPLSESTHFALIVAVLSSDIFLPVPSSMVSTYGGAVLGVTRATAASWIGMTIGAVIGFALARLFGQTFAARRANADDLARMAELSARFGPLTILFTRALPILAEASVLLMGATGLSWRKFLPPLIVANLGIALVYSAFGRYFEGRDALPAAIAISGGLPLLAALFARRLLPPRRDAGTATPDA